MKKTIISLAIALSTTVCVQNVTPVFAEEKPVQHLELPDITSLDEAKNVFSETSAELNSKSKLDATELHEIHMTTYSLEKAVAYFVENMQGDQQVAAEKMAEVVELVHLASENSRAEETRIYLEDYSKRASSFAKHFSSPD